jgi:16S rRNA (adenine1518-N6/adenine1519-N6)-dimethyltransferase
MTSIIKELREQGVVPRKGWGQHFLTDRNILEKTVRSAEIDPSEVVLEVGPGPGEMTLALAREARKVIAVEIDPQLARFLEKRVEGMGKIEIHRQDILEVDLRVLIPAEDRPAKVVANLPYKISTPLLFRFIEAREVFSSLTLMLQKEVAERLAASPGGKEYGSLSIFTQMFWDLKILFSVKATCFFPPPRVESAVIRMVRREQPAAALDDEEGFRRVVRDCFNYRRKTLANALKYSGYPPASVEAATAALGIDPRRRPETLTLEEFARLAAALRPGARKQESGNRTQDSGLKNQETGNKIR